MYGLKDSLVEVDPRGLVPYNWFLSDRLEPLLQRFPSSEAGRSFLPGEVPNDGDDGVSAGFN